MQRMHQSYKYMKAQQKKLSGCGSNLLAHEDLGHLRRPIVGIYKPSSIMKNSHQYMKVTTQETLYHEDHGATLKHKCGKRIVTLSLLSFSLIFWAFSFFMAFLFFYSSLGTMLQKMMIITLLFIYNSILEQSMTLYECLRPCTRMCNDSRAACIKMMKGGFATNTMSTT